MDAKDSRQPISVCFISPKSYPLFNDQVTSVFGGAEVDAWLLATELAKDSQFKVSVIVADYGQPPDEMRDGARIIKGVDFGRSAVASGIGLWRAMNASNAQIFFLESASPGVPFANTYCCLKGRKWVYRLASRLESDGTYLKKHPILGRLFFSALKHAGGVIAQNESDRAGLARLAGIDAQVIPNGQLISPAIAKENAGPVLWVGRSDPVKRPELFLELAGKFPAERFVMVCQKATGDTKYDQLKNHAKGIPNLEFIERVPFRQVDKYFQQARVFVNTSDSEGFPNAFIQACKNSTAILSLNVDPDGFLSRQRCGIVCGGSFEKLISSLAEMLSSGAYVEMGVSGRKYAAATHDISVIIERYKKLFVHLVRGKV